MPSYRFFKGIQVSDVVDCLFKSAHESRGKTDPLDTQSLELAGNEKMLKHCGGRVCLIERDLKFKRRGAILEAKCRYRFAVWATARPYFTAARTRLALSISRTYPSRKNRFPR